MQIFIKQNLAFLAVPKTGSTAYELALRGEADIVFARRRKHLTAGQFQRKLVPFLADSFDLHPERMAIMRDPIEQIRSWYRYRTAPKSRFASDTSSSMSFDDFVRGVLQNPQPSFCAIGSQYNFLTMSDGHLPLEHVFAYEAQETIRSFLSDRFGQHIAPAIKNPSPQREAPLSAEVEDHLRHVRAAEFALYDRIRKAGGHLQPETAEKQA